MPSRLQELQGKLRAKRENLKKIFDQAKVGSGNEARWDLLKADAFQHLTDEAHAREKIKEYTKEIDELADEVKSEQNLYDTEAKLRKQIEASSKVAEEHIHAGSQGQGELPQQMLSFGQLLLKYMPHPSEMRGMKIKLEREFSEWSFRSLVDKSYEMKAVMTTTAGWAPYATPIPRLAEFAVAGLEVTDLFPSATTEMFQVPYFEETTRTNPAVETAENTAFPEATLATTLRTVAIVKIPVILPVTDEQMMDVPGLADYVDSRLRTFVRERLDLQLLMGDGIAPNMLGTVNTPNVQTQAKGADSTVDAVYKAMDKVMNVGFANPGAVVINPTNFQPVRLMKDTTGNYIWGSPSEVGPMRMWGIPVVKATRMAVGTAQVGDYVGHTQLWIRQGVDVQVGYVDDDFKFGRQSVRATLRAGLAVYRPTAICNVTGL